jgi:hypothetical protein
MSGSKDQSNRAHVEDTVEVVNVSMLPSAVMYVVLGHGDFRTVKDGRLETASDAEFRSTASLTSFMSFQMKRFEVEPRNLLYLNRPVHQVQLKDVTSKIAQTNEHTWQG